MSLMLERVIFDPLTEDATNAPLELTGREAGHALYLGRHNYPSADIEQLYVAGRDTEGDQRVGKPRRQNRRLEYEVMVAEAMGIGAATNLLTNPSIETAATGYSALNGGSVSRVATERRHGEYSLRYDGTNGSAFQGPVLTSPNDSLVAGQSYTFAVGMKIPPSAFITAPGVLFLIQWQTNAAVPVGAQVFGAPTLGSVALSNEWVRAGISGVAPALATKALIGVLFSAGSAGVYVAYFDGFSLWNTTGQATPPIDYFDGDSPGCRWTGTTHASTSQRYGTGADSKRFTKALFDVESKLAKFQDRGGTVLRILPSGDEVRFDVESAAYAGEWQRQFNQGKLAFPFELTGRPGARTTPVLLSDHVETTLPVLKWTETSVPGNLPALGDLQVDNDVAQDQLTLLAGWQQDTYDPATTADLFYEAEAMTAQGGAANTADGAASGGNIVRQGTLTDFYQSMLSTQLLSGSAHLTHFGEYLVIARLRRPAGNTGKVSVRLEWSTGDFRKWRMNDPVVYEVNEKEGDWLLADLGVVSIPKITGGTQRWEGRITAKSTVIGDDLDIDYLLLFPCEGFLHASALTNLPTPTSVSARSDFSELIFDGVALNGAAMSVGGPWVTSGTDPDDFLQFATADYIYRAVGADGSNVGGRFARATAAGLAGVVVEGSTALGGVAGQSQPGFQMVAARYVDANNWLIAGLDTANWDALGAPELVVIKRVAGTVTELLRTTAPTETLPKITKILTSPIQYSMAENMRIRLAVSSSGVWRFFVGKKSDPDPPLIGAGYDAVLATAGALASGGVGFYDVRVAAGGPTRTYDDFLVYPMAADAAMFASRSLRWRHDGVLRHDSAGAIWAELSKPDGDQLWVPPTGRQGRPVRFLVKPSRGLIEERIFDGGIDDVSARLTVTPRVLDVPDPA